MKKIFILLAFISILFSCSNGGNASSSNTPITNIPIGTTVKLEAYISSGSTIPTIQYKDGQGNTINLTNVPNNWSTTYQVTTSIPNIWLGATSSVNSLVTGKIYINGVLTKNATANASVILFYP